MAKTHFFHYHLPLSSQINAMETFDYGFSSFTSPPLLLFHANSSDLVPNVLGSLFLGLHLYFWVWVFVCVWVCVSNVQRQGNVWQRPTSSATTIGDATNGGYRSLSSFSVLIFFFFLFWFGSLLVWVLFNLWIGFERGFRYGYFQICGYFFI